MSIEKDYEKLREALVQIRDSTFRSALMLRSIADRALADTTRWSVTDLGNAYRTAMQSGAKLNGEVKAGEGGDATD